MVRAPRSSVKFFPISLLRRTPCAPFVGKILPVHKVLLFVVIGVVPLSSRARITPLTVVTLTFAVKVVKPSPETSASPSYIFVPVSFCRTGIKFRVISVTSDVPALLTATALTVTLWRVLDWGSTVSVVPSRVLTVFPFTLGSLPSVVYRTIQPSPAETVSSAGDVAAYNSCVRASAAFRAGAEGDCSLS